MYLHFTFIVNFGRRSPARSPSSPRPVTGLVDRNPTSSQLLTSSQVTGSDTLSLVSTTSGASTPAGGIQTGRPIPSAKDQTPKIFSSTCRGEKEVLNKFGK